MDGGDSLPSVVLPESQRAALEQMCERTASDPSHDPITGADLGSGVTIRPDH